MDTRPKEGTEQDQLRVTFQFSSVAQLCPTLCDLMDCSTTGFCVHHQVPEFTQTHVHRVGDVIQPSHPLSFPSSPAFSLSQHQGLFQEYWSRLLFLPPGDLPEPGIECVSCTVGGFFTTESPVKPHLENGEARCKSCEIYPWFVM